MSIRNEDTSSLKGENSPVSLDFTVKYVTIKTTLLWCRNRNYPVYSVPGLTHTQINTHIQTHTFSLYGLGRSMYADKKVE